MNSSLHDDFSRTPVANFNLRPWWYFLTIEMGALISIPIFFIGGQLGFGLSMFDLVLATLTGGFILGLIGALTGRLGAITRCSTALIARASFGSRGAACISLILALGMSGWWAVQTEMFSDAVIRLVQTLFRLQIPREIMVLVGGSAMITTAALGIKAIGRLAYLAAPLLIAGLSYGFFSMLASHGWQRAITYEPDVGVAIGLGPAIAMVVSVCIVGVSMNPDFSRFALNTKHAIGYALSVLFICYPVVLILCGIMAIGFRTKDVFVHLAPPEFTWLLLVLMMLATWAVNDCNLYSSSLGLTAVFPRLKRSLLAIVAGVFGIILAEFRLTEHMMSFLSFLGVLIAPITGVFIIGAIDPRDPLNPEQIAPVPQWRIGQLLAWLGGALLGYMTMPREALGLGLFKITTVPTLDAVIGAAVIMLLIKLMQRKPSIQIPDVVPRALTSVENSYVGALDDAQ
jgi:cytosine permease